MKTPRILIVEDEAIVAMEIEERLTALGYHVAGLAASGEEALALAVRQRPDLILMDVRLQGNRDGIDTAREVRERLRVPVIFLTAYSEDATLERAKFAEPYGYILKPFDGRELKSAIEIALYKHAAEEEIRRLNRLYDVLSQVNQAIVYLRTRKELLPTICRLVVERGGVDMAWIGWLDEESSRISPVAHFRKHHRMIEEMHFFADDRPEGWNIPGLAIREGQPVVCNECRNDCELHAATKSPAIFDFQSCASFPLRVQGQVRGVLALCTEERHFFRDREKELLEEVAVDISFALDKIEDDACLQRIQEDLQTSESRYRRLFDEATEGIVLADAATGEFLDCNRAFAEMTGYEPRELIGKRQSLLEPSKDKDSLASPLFALFRDEEGGKVIAAEIVTRSGATKPVEIKASLLDIDGRRVVQAFFRDVTEEVRYRWERETTLRLLRLLNDPSDSREMIRDVTGFLKGWSGCEAVGVRLRDGDDFPYFETRGFSAQFVMAETHLCLHDEQGQQIRDRHGNPVLDCMCGNILSGRFDPDLPFFTSKGSFWTNSTTELLACASEADLQARTRNRCNREGYESVALIPLRYGPQTLGLMQMNDRARDRFSLELITFLENAADQIAMALSQRQAQAELGISEKRFRDVIEASGEFIWESDVTGCLSYITERVEAILEYSPHEITGRPPSDFMDAAEARALRAFFKEKTQAKAGFRDLEYRVIAKGGRSVWLSATALPILNETGELIGYRGTTRDITARKQSEEEKAKLELQLRQAQKLEAIGTLAGGVAHDFNNILTPIMGYTEMALDSAPESTPLRYELNQILAAANRAKDLVKQILTFSRVDQDQLMRPTDIGLVVKEALKLLKASLPSSIQIKQNIQKVMAVADATQIHQILINLCTNAAHAMGERGSLEVALTEVSLSDQDLSVSALSELRAGSYVKLRVADTGHDMSAATIEQIFDPYFTTKEIGEGTGLGLAVVHGIVKKHGGAVSVQSTVGVGSSFEVFLPALKTELQAPAAGRLPLPRGTERVLLVDDEEMIAALGSRMLAQLGYHVTTITDPREARELFLATPQGYDLLITDYTMPHLTGMDLSRELLKTRPGLPIILCTGFNEKVTPEGAKAVGISELLIKPCKKGQLADIVRQVLDASQAQ